MLFLYLYPVIRSLLLGCVFFFVINGYSQYPNILIGNLGNPEETSIAINPKNPDQMVAGANIHLYYYSGDGGLTWTMGSLSSTFGVWGDPCIIADTAGVFYFIHLSDPPGGTWIDRMVCQKSFDGGHNWSDGTFTGLNGTKNQDKGWCAVNPLNNHLFLTWTQFDKYGSDFGQDSSVILFSKSTDNAQSWSNPVRINRKAGNCLDADSTVEGAVPAVGPEGQIYTSWAGPDGILFTRSLDDGNTWPDTNIFVTDIPGGWDFGISGISRANGLPVTCCDISSSPYRGNIYINWSDQRNGETDTDIWFVKSLDGGNTWTSPKRVNDDPPGKQQFFTWMTVDPVTGYIYIVFYDRRDQTDDLTDVYIAVSRDGGDTFANSRISETPFNSVPQVFFGDYTGITAYNNKVRPIWTRLDSGSLSIWTAAIDSIYTGTDDKTLPSVPFSMEQNYPNPVNSYTWFSYKMHRQASVTLRVMDVFGRVVATLCENKQVTAGKYIEYLDVAANQISPGIYYFSLVSNEQTIRRKMIVE